MAARVLSSLGVREESLRADIAEIFGAPDRPPIDPDALATVGIDLNQVRERVEDLFGAGALERTRAGSSARRLRFCPRAKKVLELSLREARALGRDYLVGSSADGQYQRLDQRFRLWGGVDSNHRPTDYESGSWQGADLQEFLNLLVRSIP
jgi:hypothetical protein